MSRRLATAALTLIALGLGACSSSSQRPTPLPAATAPLPSMGGAPMAQPGYGAAPGNAQPGYGGAPMVGSPGPVAGGGGGSCNAQAASFLVGELGTNLAAEQAKDATGAASVRILFPGQPITKEFIGDRLNLDTNAENRITSVRCG